VTTAPRPTHARHVVLWLTVALYMITYMDRVVMSTVAPEMRKDLGIDLTTMSFIIGAFSWSYALFQIPGGVLGDKLGPRRALSLIVIWWSAFTSFTAMAVSATALFAIRFLFGVGEAGAFPIATRSFSRWIVTTQRGYAQGVTHAGSRLGGAIALPLTTWIMLNFGWRTAFFAFATLGVVWATTWYWYYRDSPSEHAGVNATELELIQKGIAEEKGKAREVPWAQILNSPTLWFLSAMYFCYNYSLNVYYNWLPTYLREFRHVTLAEMGFYGTLPLLAGVAGDTLGGWVSDRMLKRTRNVHLARRWVAIPGFILCAFATVPAVFATDVQASIMFYMLAFFALEWTVGISWAVPLDIGGDFAGSISAFMNMCGNIGGAIATSGLGLIVAYFGWNVPFLITGVLTVLAALLYLKIDASKRIV
jgi:sugar phosphate permease